MKIKILSLLILITALSASAQVDSSTIRNLESKLIKQINQQKVGFNQELSDIKNLQDNRLKQALDELSVLTKSQKITQLKLDSLSEKQALSNQIALGLEKQITSLESQLNDKVNGLKTETIQLGAVTNSLSEGLTNAKNEVSEIAESSSKNTNSIDTVNQALSQKQQYGLIFIGLFC